MAPREGADPFAQPFVTGAYERAGRRFPLIATEWSAADRWGAAGVRWGIGRYDYLVVPGVYVVGEPSARSPVLVTANYKLSFDILRREVAGLDVYLLVLETMGINVWCAAGKGTFGTDELCRRVETVELAELVDHRRLIVPQLGAPGVAAHIVKERTGFRVRYGPVEARDIPRFLEQGTVSDEMRRKRFPVGDRTRLIPMELVPSMKYALPLTAALALFAALLGPAGSLLGPAVPAAVAVALAVVCGAVLTPLLLPWIPGRAFATKGGLLGVVVAAPLIALAAHGVLSRPGWWWLDATGLSMLGVALASFLAMNFTGSSSYTSLSGVEKEMRRAVPLQALGAGAGLLCWCLSIALLR